MGRSQIEKIIEKRINNFFNDFSISVPAIDKGIIFLYAEWSPTIIQFTNLMNSIENLDHFKIYIFDIDHPDFFDFKVKNKLDCHGWGETFWIKNGKIIATLKKYGSDNLNELIGNNTSLNSLI